MATTDKALNWAQEFYSMLIALAARPLRLPRAAHANGPTKPRGHRGNHTMHAGQRARFMRGRFTTPEKQRVRELFEAASVRRIAGPNPSPDRLADANRIVRGA